MNIQILAARKAKAMERIAAAADGVSKTTGAPGYLLNGLVATNKDKEVEGMLRMEAVADLMEWLRGVPPSTSVDNGDAEPMSDVDQVLALPAAKVIEFVKEQNDPVYVGALLFGEDNGKKRKSVLTAIEARVQALAGQAIGQTPSEKPIEQTPAQSSSLKGEEEEE